MCAPRLGAEHSVSTLLITPPWRGKPTLVPRLDCRCRGIRVRGECVRRLLPVSRRFVSTPVQMTYSVTESHFVLFRLGVAAWSLPRAIEGIFRVHPLCPDVRKADIHGDEPICLICCYGVADNFAPVRQVT